MANLKNITDLPMAASAEGLNLIVNDNGAAKQIAADAICKVKSVNGAQPDENGNVQVETSWSDLPDKPFYTEMEAILEKQTVDGFVDEFGIGSAFVDLPPVEVIGGEKYIVFWDDEKYELTANGEGIGVSLDFGSNNLDPFMLVSYTDSLRVQTTSINTSHEVGIYRETVHKLDAKYLPEWDAKIELDGGNSIDTVNKLVLTEGSYSKVVEKIKNKEVPKISIFWLYDYTGWMMEITSTPYMTIMNEDLTSNTVEIHFRGMHTTDFVIYLKPDNTVVGDL